MRLAPLAALALSVTACPKPGAEPASEAKPGPAPVAVQTPQSAAGSITPGATRVTECPRSLGGAEAQIDRVISKDCGPVTVVEDYRVDNGSLTLEAGATLQFKDGAALIVGASEPAKLLVAGTPTEPVTLTSASDKAAGAWRGVELGDKAARSQIQGAVIEFAGTEERALWIAAAEVTLEGTTIREARGPAIRLEGAGSLASFTGNTLRKLGSKAAIVAPATAVIGIAGGNRFDGEAVVQVLGGDIGAPTTWPNPGVPLRLNEEVRVGGAGPERAVLNLSPGTELRFGPEGRLSIGSSADGGLVARGTSEAPITFTAGDRRQAGGWGGLQIWARGEADLEHAAFEFGGGGDEGTAALMVEDGALSLRETTFRSNRAGVAIRGKATLRALADNRFAATKRALELPADLVGALGEGNAFDSDGRIVVVPGAVTSKATWAAHGAPLELSGEVLVGAELTLEAGLRVLAGPEAALIVGSDAPAALLAHGTAEAPIQLAASAGVWRGIKLHGKTLASTLQHVELSQTGAEPAVWVEAPTEVRLDNVTCAKCKAAVVGWQCGASVSQSAVLATDGTPAIDAPPQGC
ncbi:hypothetical protein [Nannocystis bainbridge]|uniref:Uncharacterized protein n=1 Tax=Nannocystis bainbridge TaxID=2995303 RepID=A0ABT5E237_9BACT|nr:hypothetical protein [Nannocystis bainbridge]MDC0719480.1 hypothetical protein [Nannocystis bainbridge]